MLLVLCTAAIAADLGFTDVTRLALADSAPARIVAASGREDRATARTDAAWAGNPELSAEVRPGETTLLLSVPVDWSAPGRGAAAADTLAAATVRERAARAAVASAAGAAYLDAVRVRDLAALAAEARELADRLRSAGDARLAAGEVAASEYALLRADAAGALDHALSLSRDATSAARLLGVLIGVSDPPTVGGMPDLAVPADLDPTRVPAVVVAELEARAALKRRHAAALSLLPALSVSGGWVVEGATGPVYGASLALPLFSPGAARVEAARAAAEGREASLDLTRLDVGATLADARAELDIAGQVAQAWDIPSLDDALDAATRRNAAGESSLVAYVSERDLALTALQSAIDARWRLQRARLALWELAGEIPLEVAR